MNKKLTELLKGLGVSHKTLAELIGVSEASFSQRIHGRINWKVEEVTKISNFLWVNHKIQVKQTIELLRDRE